MIRLVLKSLSFQLLSLLFSEIVNRYLHAGAYFSDVCGVSCQQLFKPGKNETNQYTISIIYLNLCIHRFIHVFVNKSINTLFKLPCKLCPDSNLKNTTLTAYMYCYCMSKRTITRTYRNKCAQGESTLKKRITDGGIPYINPVRKDGVDKV